MSHQNAGNPAQVYPYGPEKKEELDTMPSDYQPPGTDEEENEPQSLEEALMMQAQRAQFSGKTIVFQTIVIGSIPIARFGIGRIRPIPFAVQTVGKDLQRQQNKRTKFT